MEEDVKIPQTEEKQKNTALQTVLNVLGVVLCVVFIPIIVLNVIMIVRSYTQPDKIPSVFGYAPVIVLSGSMSPAFEEGDMIVIQSVDPNTLKVNDVICYMEEESAVTHRIIEIQQQDGETLYITQGDANNVEDAVPVAAGQVQGKYTGIRLEGWGNFAIYLQSTPGMLIFIGGPILLFILWDLLRRMVQSRKTKGQKQALEEELERLRAQVGGQDQNGPQN